MRPTPVDTGPPVAPDRPPAGYVLEVVSGGNVCAGDNRKHERENGGRRRLEPLRAG